MTTVIWNKGDKVNLCLYMGALYKGRSDPRRWTTRKILYIYACMALGLRDTKQTQRMLQERAQAAAVTSLPGDGPGDRPTMNQGDRAVQVKTTAENQMHLACLMYADETNREKQALITAVPGPTGDWHGRQNKESRTAEAGISWQMRQSQHDLLECLRATLSKVNSFDGYSAMGVETSWKVQEDVPVHHPMVKGNDDMSSLLFDISFSLVRHRAMRTLPMWEGWPKRCALLPGPEMQETVMCELRNDSENFKCLAKMPQSWAKRIVARSAFRTRSLEQIVLACAKEAWQMTSRSGSMAGVKWSPDGGCAHPLYFQRSAVGL